MKGTTPDGRCASLIRRWLAGKKLTPEDAVFVSTHGHIPATILQAGPFSPGAKETIRGALNTRKHAKYPQTYPNYAAVYGYKDEKTIKRFVRRGKELGDLPPLEHPQEMAAWYRRCMDNRVPDNLLAMQGFSDPRVINGDAAATTKSSEEGKPRDLSHIKGMDLEQNVQALRQSHAINVYLWNEALHDPEPNENFIALRQRNQDRSFEQLRKAEITLIEFKKMMGGLVDPEPIRTELAQVFESLRSMREPMALRIMAELERILPRRFQRVFRVLEKYLIPAIETVRVKEEALFRNLETISSPEEIERRLAA